MIVKDLLHRFVHLEMVSAYLKSIDEASNLDEVSRCIYDAINSDDLYTFGELLNNAKVISLKNSPKHAKFYTLLQLFAYGVYSDVPALKNEIPELNDVMVQKLRQLTLISLCNQHKRCISIKDAMQSLYL
ncbi:unnamed protein product, partial [Anisakis simplex]|uniref:COP9 signalosome complex subunit 7 (inferred by orthology to a D. melanogaster protein) n=1 Tax=Anisakis simplex TaxID=6269 RepID=A0A0M3JI07_ANISI